MCITSSCGLCHVMRTKQEINIYIYIYEPYCFNMIYQFPVYISLRHHQHYRASGYALKPRLGLSKPRRSRSEFHHIPSTNGSYPPNLQ